MGCLPGCRCARCYTPCYDPCPGGWTNFRSGSCCQPVLFDAFLGGRHYPIATGTVTVTVATSNGIFVSSPNPTIANQAALLVWLNGVLVEAANVGFSSFGNFTAVGGYLMPARIGNTCVTGLTPILTT